MLATPLRISAALLVLLSFSGLIFSGAAHAAATHAAKTLAPLPERIAAAPIEQVRFEARGDRTARHARRARAETCRRCRRAGDTYAVLAISRHRGTTPKRPPTPPQRATFRMITDTLGPLRLRLYSSTWVEACEEKHPTFVARTGSYLADDGARQRCE